jgi:hypothetical protein
MAGLGGGLHGNGAGCFPVSALLRAPLDGNGGDINLRSCLRPEVLWSALASAIGTRVLTRNLGPSSIPSLSDGVMLGTAWIDRPVDTRGLHSLLPRLP